MKFESKLSLRHDPFLEYSSLHFGAIFHMRNFREKKFAYRLVRTVCSRNRLFLYNICFSNLWIMREKKDLINMLLYAVK